MENIFRHAGDIYAGIGSKGTYTVPQAQQESEQKAAQAIHYMATTANNIPATRIAQDLLRTRGSEYTNNAIQQSLAGVDGNWQSPVLAKLLQRFLNA